LQIKSINAPFCICGNGAGCCWTYTSAALCGTAALLRRNCSDLQNQISNQTNNKTTVRRAMHCVVALLQSAVAPPPLLPFVHAHTSYALSPDRSAPISRWLSRNKSLIHLWIIWMWFVRFWEMLFNKDITWCF
jgi:hypothetical protein